MARNRSCEGWPHAYDPQNCPIDWQQYQRETATRETTMGDREQFRASAHTNAELLEAKPAELPAKK